MRSQIRRIVAAAPHHARPVTYYYELEQTYYSVTSGTFVGQLLGLLGMKSIADQASGAASSGGYPQLSAEYILKANPDYIILADTICCHQDAASVAKRPGWSGLAAVKAGHIVALNDDIASRWGPRVTDLLRDVRPGWPRARRGEDRRCARPSRARGRPGRPGPRWPGSGRAGAIAVATAVPRRRPAGWGGHAARPACGDVRSVARATGHRAAALGIRLLGCRPPSTRRDMIWQIRLPRVVLGGLVGAMLAAGGAAYQGVFRNPLADPYLLGVAAGGGLGATIVIVAGGSADLLPPAAFPARRAPWP